MNKQQPAKGLSRRNALIAGGGAIAAIGAFAASPLGNTLTAKARALLATLPGAQRFLSLAHGSYEEWLAQVGTSFAAGGGASLRLSGVRAAPFPSDRPLSVSRRKGFVAVFDVQGGRTTMAGELIYTLTHTRYGPFQAFLSASSDGRRMYAEYN